MYVVRRWIYAFRNFRNYPAELNRRASVEQQMWDCVAGRKPMPNREQLAEWARKLGIPDWMRERMKARGEAK